MTTAPQYTAPSMLVARCSSTTYINSRPNASRRLRTAAHGLETHCHAPLGAASARMGCWHWCQREPHPNETKVSTGETTDRPIYLPNQVYCLQVYCLLVFFCTILFRPIF